jgi:nucleoside-triphosphatase
MFEPMHKPVILLTGQPGIGKTTVIKAIVSLLGDKAGGFYTREVRARGRRVGFEIVTLAGQTGYLATKDPDISFRQEARFGTYRVNLEGIDSVAVPALYRAMEQGQIVVIDEIGPMEILSKPFCQAVLEMLDSEAPVLGTIVQRRNAFADQVKEHPRVTVRQVTVTNRDRIAEGVYNELAQHLARN